MGSGADYLNNLNRYCLLLLGDDDTGKTRCALSFPKPYIAASDPHGLAIARYDRKLREQLAQGWVTYLVPDKGDLEAFFSRKPAKDARPEQNIYRMIEHVRELADRGEIETFVLDPITYLATTYFEKMKVHDASQWKSSSGVLDTRGMYGELGNWLQNFILHSILPLTKAGPHGLNVIVTCHLMRESEEKVNDDSKMPLNKGVDIKPMILGGYRDRISKPFGSVLVFETDLRQVKVTRPDGGEKVEERKVFWCYCSKSVLKKSNGEAGFGEGTIAAKDKYGLLGKFGPRFKMNDRYLYDELETIAGAAAASSTDSGVAGAAAAAPRAVSADTNITKAEVK